MALTCFTDPGKVPRASSEEIHHMSSMPPRAPHMYVVNGVHVTTKFCETCGIQRPPRCTHCRSSDRCIEKWDHYCPWLGTAIGRRNYAFFVIFVWVTATLAAWVGSFAIAHLRTVGTQLRSASPADALSLLSILPVVHAADWPLAVRALAAAPLSGVLAAYGVFVGLALLVLGCFHCYLIWINQTTYEHHQHDAWNEDDEDASRFERERSTPQSERSTALSFTPSSLSFTPPSGEPPPSPKAEAWADEGDEDGDDDGPDALALPPGTGAAIESVSLFLQAPQG
ncbi:putative palmitoyltransferase zdhhc14-like protein [Chrysochromulina tobinii]|uniref:Palmitoyltransferase n=1 Tax=Chrysochromulina tobinii TaxID=1460289 RepID=A0A0M0K1K3_9EUKA|nr:putative palmitoyltransferase zdhhc14-like protein [Chrysochromulina tobinii]|eukprot:KOO32447.1 putative palmitoyltransferase zdhhc14-like protein [Chrysochromulina sp. CCMP291]